MREDTDKETHLKYNNRIKNAPDYKGYKDEKLLIKKALLSGRII
jgi:hypothetical protein